MGTAAAPSEDLDATIEASTKAVDTFSEALRVTGFTVPDLVAAGLLPATISWSAVQDARRRVEDAQRRVKEKSANSDWWRVIAANLPLLDIFVSTLRRCGRPLSPAITLALQLQHDL